MRRRENCASAARLCALPGPFGLPHNRGVPRRIHVSHVVPGESALDEREAHHVRNVLRLKPPALVEVFDDAGNVGIGTLAKVDGANVTVVVEAVEVAPQRSVSLRIASAIPKAGRADWMVEKLSELGVDAFIPLAAERSVVLPEGKNKLDRWQRLAAEAAKQSRRRGVMQVQPLARTDDALRSAQAAGEAWQLSTAAVAVSIREIEPIGKSSMLTLFIGPEGGWSPAEIHLFEEHRVPAVSLSDATILRVETAAIAAAAVVGAWFLFNPRPPP
jgi:16S rRNA (uracil1498-N3)-methyltransferase